MTAPLSPASDALLVSAGDTTLSQREFLAWLHRRGQLVPLLRQALAEKLALAAARAAGLAVAAEELQQAADAFRRRHPLRQSAAGEVRCEEVVRLPGCSSVNSGTSLEPDHPIAISSALERRNQMRPAGLC